MTGTRTAVVIGGGIAGPAAAVALRQAGIEATVYEARPRTDGGAGVFLTLASNGIDALRTDRREEPCVGRRIRDAPNPPQ